MKMRVLAAVGLLVASSGFAKDKAKKTLPPYVLAATTVAVVIDPEAGEPLADPRANRVAQKDVETALLNWGRFQTVMGIQEADLVIVVRRGTGKFISQTVKDPRQGDRTGVINPTDEGISIGAQHGPHPAGPTPGESGPQSEVGSQDDSFIVYEGNRTDPNQNPMDNAPAWRYMGKDALRPHTMAPHAVPAVEEFRKAVAEAEKAAKQP
jgi:hypothetical protein